MGKRCGLEISTARGKKNREEGRSERCKRGRREETGTRIRDKSVHRMTKQERRYELKNL